MLGPKRPRVIAIPLYWINIIQRDDTTILKKIYNFLKTDANLNNSYKGKNWAYHVKSILEQHGLGDIWLNQTCINNHYYMLIKQRILDTYSQSWYGSINNSDRLQTYSIFKHDFKLEKHLEKITDHKFRTALTRFRISSHNLFIETGRYDNTPRSNRICKSCNMGVIESEFHFLLVCPKFRDLRKSYFTSYYCHWPDIRKFENLMSSTSLKTIRNISKFIYFASKQRIT